MLGVKPTIRVKFWVEPVGNVGAKVLIKRHTPRPIEIPCWVLLGVFLAQNYMILGIPMVLTVNDYK